MLTGTSFPITIERQTNNVQSSNFNYRFVSFLFLHLPCLKVLEWAKIILTWILDIHRHFHPFEKKEKNEGFHLAVKKILPDQA